RHLASRPTVDPLIGVQSSERATRTDVDQPRSLVVIRARAGEVELLLNRPSLALKKIGSEETDQSRGAETEPRPRHAVTLPVCGDRCVVRARLVTELWRHPTPREPRVADTA